MNKIEILKRQKERIIEVREKARLSPDFKKWHRDTEVAIEKVFGANTRHLEDFRAINYRLSIYSTRTPEFEHFKIFLKGLNEANAILQSFIDELTDYAEINQEQQMPDSINRILRLTKKFHAVVRQLRHRHSERSTLDVMDEYDVQDLLHALLQIDFNDIRAEEWVPSYAGGCSRIDFFLKQEGVAIEVKKTRASLNAKALGEQLIVDIKKYMEHPNCTTLICFVYDPEGYITNPSGIENDLSQQHGKLQVVVVIEPK